MEPYKKINESNFDFPGPLNRNGICSCSALSIVWAQQALGKCSHHGRFGRSEWCLCPDP